MFLYYEIRFLLLAQGIERKKKNRSEHPTQTKPQRDELQFVVFWVLTRVNKKDKFFNLLFIFCKLRLHLHTQLCSRDHQSIFIQLKNRSGCSKSDCFVFYEIGIKKVVLTSAGIKVMVQRSSLNFQLPEITTSTSVIKGKDSS